MMIADFDTLAAFLKSRGLTVKQLQAVTGKSRQTLYNWFACQPDFLLIVVAGIAASNAVNDINLDDLPY